MREQNTLSIELLRRTGAGETGEAAKEWRAWCDLPVAFAQVSMELVRIEKIGSAPGPAPGQPRESDIG
jgi:hypothetical protein